MFKVILLSVILLFIAMSFLAINILFRKNGKFPEYRVGHNRNMKKLGIKCVKHEEFECYRKYKAEICSSCGLVDNR